MSTAQAGRGAAVGNASPRTSLSAERMAEQVLLGCVLVDDFEVWGELDQHPIEAEDFLFPEHKALWRAFRWLYSEGLEVTMPSTVCALSQMQTLSTVDQWLDRAGYAGVEEYLTELLSVSFSAKGCSAFLRAVQHYSDMRAPASPSTRWEIGL